MNKFKISGIFILVLLVILGGVIMYSITTDDPTGDDQNDVTPFDTSESILSSTPPGITETDENRLEIDGEELINAHTTQLISNSATININENNAEYTFNTDSTSTYVEQNNGDIVEYSNDIYTLINNQGQYNAREGSIEDNEFTKENEFKSFIRSLDVDTFDETNDGHTRIILTDTDEDMDTLPEQFGFEDINSVTVELIITDDGLITESEYEIIGSINGVRDVVTSEYSVSDVGNTDVTEPNWVSNAENTVTIVDGLYDSIEGWMLIEHKHLTTIPQGEEIMITNRNTDETDTVTLPSDFEEGDSLGLSLLEDGTWDVTVNDTPEEGASSDATGYNVKVEHDDGQEYFNITLRD